MVKGASYSRYSSELQNERSIEDQNRITREEIDRQGLSFSMAYSDFAISGSSMKRQGLQEMMAHAAQGEFNILVVEGLDRLSRDQEDIAHIYKRLTFHGVKIFSLQDGGFVSDIHIAFGGAKNAMFLKDLAFKVHRGIRGHIESGRAITKSYGYDIVRRFDSKGEPVRGERSINPIEAAIVRRIFERYAKGQSARKIVLTFNQEGIPSPKGAMWSATTLNGCRKDGRGILNNELYIGRLIWNKHSYKKNPDTEKRITSSNDKDDWVVAEVPELRIIDQALWDKVKARQEILTHNNYAHLKRRPKHLLSYLLKCGTCGGGFGKISAASYGCTRSRSHNTCDNRRTILKYKLEAAVLNALEHQLMQPELVDVFVDEYNRHIKTLNSTSAQSTDLIEQQLQKLDTDKAKLIDAIKQGIPASELKDEFNRLALQRESLTQKLNAPIVSTQSISVDLGERYHAQIKDLRALLDNEDKADETIDLIRQTIDKVVLTPDPITKKLKVSLYGDLAGMLNIGSSNEAELSFDAETLNQFTDNHKQQVMNTTPLSRFIV